MMKLLAVASLAVASALSLEVTGPFNCENKCEKVFSRTQYAISDQPGQSTFEYRACLLGCNECQAELDASLKDDVCFTWCKNFDYTGAGIRKGIIEPDKACLMGCVINTCQEVCIGGTVDPDVTPANQYLWWNQPGSTGCSIKTGLGYVQNLQYGNPNSPGGQGGDAASRQCCSNALNLCQYSGNAVMSNPNYARVVKVSKRSCKKYVPSQQVTDICTWQADPQNCGTSGMPI